MQFITEFLFGKLQHIIPQFLLTKSAGRLATLQLGNITTKFLSWYSKHYNVKISEAAEENLKNYKSFQKFFTRALKPDARPLANSEIVCPVDGKITQFGQIDESSSFIAKGSNYSAASLLGGDSELSDKFKNGSFSIFYLSPGDYHRIHMPCDGRLEKMTYIPGKLFSVNPITTSCIPGIFTRNERVVCTFNSNCGPVAVVLIGAAIVGGISTTWHGLVNIPHATDIFNKDYTQSKITLKKGEEMGRFLLGSTVVLLFSDPKAAYNPAWSPEKKVRMGEMIN